MLKRLASYLMGYQGYAAASPLLVVLETACELILPLLMARIINEGIEGEHQLAQGFRHHQQGGGRGVPFIAPQVGGKAFQQRSHFLSKGCGEGSGGGPRGSESGSCRLSPPIW